VRRQKPSAAGAGAPLVVEAEEMERDLRAIRRALHRPFEEEIAKGGLTVPQKAVMQVIVGQDGISLKDLSIAVSLAHSTVSGIVDRLEKRGMIERRPDARDGRIRSIHASAPVTKFIRETIPELSRGPLATALERTTGEERKRIGWALKRLRELLEAWQS
jgi:DNA-binding MarR family transcriptional regulator